MPAVAAVGRLLDHVGCLGGNTTAATPSAVLSTNVAGPDRSVRISTVLSPDIGAGSSGTGMVVSRKRAPRRKSGVPSRQDPRPLLPAARRSRPAASVQSACTPSVGLVDDRSPSLRQEWDTARPELLVTLRAEPAKALGLSGPSKTGYGYPNPVTVWGRQVRHLALVHPCQAGGLGAHSGDWATAHDGWMASSPAP